MGGVGKAIGGLFGLSSTPKAPSMNFQEKVPEAQQENLEAVETNEEDNKRKYSKGDLKIPLATNATSTSTANTGTGAKV